MSAVAAGKEPDLTDRDEADTPFYILGLSPNAARLSVRFWYPSTVKEMMQRIGQHSADLRIEKVHPKIRNSRIPGNCSSRPRHCEKPRTSRLPWVANSCGPSSPAAVSQKPLYADYRPHSRRPGSHVSARGAPQGLPQARKMGGNAVSRGVTSRRRESQSVRSRATYPGQFCLLSTASVMAFYCQRFIQK